MTDVAALLRPEPKPRYDFLGRYLLRLPGEEKPTGRTRLTTFLKAIDDGGGLLGWQGVMVACGVMDRTDIRAKWAALLARHPDPFYDTAESKAEALELADQAKEAARANAKRDTGTALHDILKSVVSGRVAIAKVNAEFRWHCEAVLAALDAAGLDVVPELSERAVYMGTYNLVGTFDVGLRHRATGKLVIGDLKSGGQTWKWYVNKTTGKGRWLDAHVFDDIKEAAQLAGYAGAELLIEWPAESEDEAVVTPMPEFSQKSGVIIHAPSNERTVTLRRLDLAVGRAALAVCDQVRKIKNAKPLLERVGDGPPS